MAEVRSTIVCPACGHRESEIIPDDACQYFYQCKGCRVVLKPKKGDCCVFCSYGDVKCPSAHEALDAVEQINRRVHGLWFEISARPRARRFLLSIQPIPKNESRRKLN